MDAKRKERRKWMVVDVLLTLAVLLMSRAVLQFESARSPVAASSTLESAIKEGGGKRSQDFDFLDPMLHYAQLQLNRESKV